MADTNEEQLLNELLRAVGKADRGMQAPGIDALEARVLDCWDSAAARRPGRSWKAAAVVAGVAAAVVIALAGIWLSPGAQAPAVATHSASFELPIPSSQAASADAAITHPPIAKPPIAKSPIAQQRQFTQSPIAQSPMEFIPLRPLSGHELSGSFQFVRVQMPLAALGGLTSPLQHPGEMVNADVLLGEDGVARAIRIAVDESNYPWRSR
jgi:hypothetical protein